MEAKNLPRTPGEQRAHLVATLAEFTTKHNLPQQSADELMLLPNIEPAQRDWLRSFCWEWDEIDDRTIALDDAVRIVSDLEGWTWSLDTLHIKRDPEGGEFGQDHDAEAYVQACARAGSLVHRYALERIEGATPTDQHP